MSKKTSSLTTITVAAVLCVVCSVLVSSTVVTLKPQQLKNADLDYKKNILMAAGLIKPGDDVLAAFEKVETVIVDLETGKLAPDVEKKKYDQVKASKDPKQNVKIPKEKDVAGLSTRAKYAKAFLTRDESGKVNEVILYIRSMGLWSTMHGFIALGADATTVKGFAYYSQGETPGLGGEVDNPAWKQQWVGKSLYDENGNVVFELAKGTVDPSSNIAQYRVDGLSGATITSVGISTSMKYWFSDHGYGKFLDNVRMGEI